MVPDPWVYLQQAQIPFISTHIPKLYYENNTKRRHFYIYYNPLKQAAEHSSLGSSLTIISRSLKSST